MFKFLFLIICFRIIVSHFFFGLMIVATFCCFGQEHLRTLADEAYPLLGHIEIIGLKILKAERPA